MIIMDNRNGNAISNNMFVNMNPYLSRHQTQLVSPLTVAPTLLAVTASSGSTGYTHQEPVALGQHPANAKWPVLFPDQHNGLSRPAHHELLDGRSPAPAVQQPVLLPQSQPPNHTYQIPVLPQTVSPTGYNQMYQVSPQQTDFIQTPQTFAQPRTTASWEPHPVPATPNSESGTDTGGRQQTVNGDASNGALLPAVGRQGTRGILPMAPGRDEPPNDEEIEPRQDPQTKKWQCPSCPATFSFPKHVKRHYMRHTGERPYECLCCRTCFARSDVLKRHYEKCTERTPGWKDIAPENRLDHLHGRRGRPNKSVTKKTPNKRRRRGSAATSGQSSKQGSRRNSRDGQFSLGEVER